MKGKGKGKGNLWGGGSWYGGAGKGGGTCAYWFDQPHQGHPGDDRTWVFSLTSTGSEIPKNTAVPPGVCPQILTSNSWAVFQEAEAELDSFEEARMTGDELREILKETDKPKKKMKRVKFQSKSQIEKKIREEKKIMDQAIKENQSQVNSYCSPEQDKMKEVSDELVKKE